MNILVVCGQGMSSSALVNKMRNTVKEKGLEDVKVGSCSTLELDTYARQADIIMLAPQLSFMKNSVPVLPGTKVIVISADEYAMQDTESLLARIHEDREEETKEDENTSNFMRNINAFSEKVQRNHILKAIASGMLDVSPVTIIGSFFALLSSLPFPGYTQFIERIGLAGFLSLASHMTIGFISLYLTWTISRHIAIEKGDDSFEVCIAACAVFFILGISVNENHIDISEFGVRGMFTAMILAVLSGELFVFAEKYFRFKGSYDKVPETVQRSLDAIIPLLICIIPALAGKAILYGNGFGSLTEVVETYLQSRLIRYFGSSVSSFLFVMFIAHLLWFFGIHGGNITGIFMDPINLSLSLENIAAVNAGGAPVNMVNTALASAYMFGGVGSTLALSFLMTFFSRSKKNRTIGKISLPMGIFFINEPILFGFPIILNVFMFIPFIMIPLISGIMTILAMQSGLIPYAVGYDVPWTTPPVISGLIQGGWRLALWQVFMFAVQVAMWYPFFRIADAKEYEEEMNSVSK